MFIIGVIGGILTIIVFLSLRTFIENTCAFYLMLMSIFNIINLFLGLLSRVLISGFNIDWTLTSSFYCGFRWYCLYVCVLVSFTMVCLSTIDQYLSTCSNLRYQQLMNIKIAHRLSLLFIILWIISAIPYMIYFNLVKEYPSNTIICTSTNIHFLYYHIYVYIISLAGAIPVIITVLFSCLAYRNIKQLSHRRLPLIRRELDRQLTTMVFVQVIHNFFVTIPYTIVTALIYSPIIPNDPIIIAEIQFISILTIFLYYFNYVSPFYIYLCASERFRHQLIYVLFKINLQRWQRRKIILGQVYPQH